MKMTTWAKPFLNPFKLSLLLGLCFSTSAYAKVELGALFVHLSDALSAVKKENTQQTKQYLQALQQEFNAIPNHDSEAGIQTSKALETAIATPTLANVEQISKDLYAFEKEQNPVNHDKNRQKFAEQVVPTLQELEQVLASKNIDDIQAKFHRFGATWGANELSMRGASLSHYGKMETAMSLFRSAMQANPANYDQMQQQLVILKNTVDDFVNNKSN
ncbi:hypothetical protein [Lonepinella sp. BR2474]|uniref:hypothetical protein n=1 Tax=Lonepinella sp. BR2474 TaxID=3434548 RepID=UPI003F6DCE0B